jgi:protein disulfide-isomerase A6
VDCTEQGELCQEQGATGYPTIKYWNAESPKDGDKYQGGRDHASLVKHIKDKLERPCDVANPASCSAKETDFIAKAKTLDAAAVKAQIARLEGMKAGKMTPELKGWLFQRLHILQQLAPKDEL